MARLQGAQRMVLQAIWVLPKDAAGYVRDTQIAEDTQIAIGDLKNWIETLEDEGYVEVARTKAGLSALITANGRLALRPDSVHSKMVQEQCAIDPAAIRPSPELLPTGNPIVQATLNAPLSSSPHRVPTAPGATG